ncbi:uncharacterized protein [Dermacentor albipictus]|uniref:uncharacterized protein n=1 Tax=Dermacentor albipictus TaxID=60249 RepID=UPI0031FBC848
MHEVGPTSRLTRTPTGARSRASLHSIGTGPGPSVPAMSSRAALSSSFQDRGHQDVAEAPHDLDTGCRSRASSAASISAAPAASVGPLPTAEAERSGGGPIGDVSGWASAISKEAIWVLGIVVALCLLLVALVYLNLSHRAGM